MSARKPANKIEKISACFDQVKESVNQIIVNQQPWLNVKGVNGIQVNVSDTNVEIGVKGGTPVNGGGSTTTTDTYPFKTTGVISGSQAVLRVEPGMIKTKYIPTIYPTSISMASRPDIIVTGNSGSVWVGVTWDAAKNPTSVYLDGGPVLPTSSTSLEILPISDWVKSGSGASASFGTINQYIQSSMTYYWCGSNVIWSRT
jgi:hypothetical protein